MLIGLVAVALDRRGVLTRDPSPAIESGNWWMRERTRWHLHLDRFEVRDSGVLLAAGGLVSYMIYCRVRFDDALAFVTVQNAPGWNQQPGIRTWLKFEFFGHLIHTSPSISLRLVAQALLTLGFLLATLLVLRRFGWGYAVYAFVIVAIPMIGTGDFQGMGRYLLACFPVFAALGDWLAAPDRDRLRLSAVVVSAVCLVALSSLFARRFYLT